MGSLGVRGRGGNGVSVTGRTGGGKRRGKRPNPPAPFPKREGGEGGVGPPSRGGPRVPGRDPGCRSARGTYQTLTPFPLREGGQGVRCLLSPYRPRTAAIE